MMQLKEILKRKGDQPVTVPTTASVADAIHAMNERKVGSVMVLEASGAPAGIFTERDVLERIGENYAKVADKPIRDFMTPNPVVVRLDDSPAAALSAIAAGGYRHVPVLDNDDHPVGVISPHRLFRYLESKFDEEN